MNGKVDMWQAAARGGGGGGGQGCRATHRLRVRQRMQDIPCCCCCCCSSWLCCRCVFDPVCDYPLPESIAPSDMCIPCQRGKGCCATHTSAALFDLVPPATLRQLVPQQLLQPLTLSRVDQLSAGGSRSCAQQQFQPDICKAASSQLLVSG